MKVRLLIFLIIVSILSPTTIYGIESGEIIIIGGEESYPPFEYLDEDGDYRGFNVDLMKALSIEMGIDIKLVPMEWIDAHIALQSGEIHAIQGMNYNDTRLNMYDFSDEFFKNSLVCFVRKDEEEILGIDNLVGKRVAVQRSDFAAYALAEIGEVELVFLPDMELAFDDLIRGQVDALVGNKLTGQYTIQKNKIEDSVKIVGNDISFTSYGMAFKKGNNEYRDEFNKALANLKKKGTYYIIYEKWFGKEIKSSWEEFKRVIFALSAIIFVIIFSNLIIYRMNSVLKEEVKKQTASLDKVNKELINKQEIINESNRYKEQILNGIGNGLVTFDERGYIITLNKSCERLLGIRERDYIYKPYYETDLKNYIEINDLISCLEEEKEFLLKEKRFYDGYRERILSYILRPLFDLNNQNIGAVLTFNDITEITSLRMKLAESEKMSSFGTMISRISHEIRNPLTSIKAYIDLLPKKYENPEFRERITRELPNEIVRLNDLLTDLIEYSKPKRFSKEDFELVQLVNQTIDVLLPELEEKKITINYLDNNPLVINGDKQQIKQILFNILRNSMDAMEEKGNIFNEIWTDGDKIIFSVIDDGKGIPEEDLKNVFNPFFTSKENGTGLGLALSYQYAQENNISIKINSKFGYWTKTDLVFGGGDKASGKNINSR